MARYYDEHINISWMRGFDYIFLVLFLAVTGNISYAYIWRVSWG